MSQILTFKNVTLKFGGITALNSVSFEVNPGELYAIIGPNGAGKTSIFNCISGIYRPTEGNVTYGSTSIQELRPDQVANLGIARTFQNIELFENMTVIDNILFGAHRQLDYGAISSLFYTKKVRNFEREAREIAEDIIDFLEIEQYRYSYILSLPYGVQKRVELGRALAMNPDIVLLDEPAAGMNSEETEDIAQRVMVLNFGEKLAEGTPKEIVSNENVYEAYLGGK